MQRSVVGRTAFLVLAVVFALLSLDRTVARTTQHAALQPTPLVQPSQQKAAVGQHPGLSKAEVDQLVAPVALYPDALLATVLIAATYPLEVAAADRWALGNRGLTGVKLKEAAAQQSWDDSVKALVHAPAVLAIMSKQIGWTNKLGEAVLLQQSDVFDAVQRLRRQAIEADKLQTTAEQSVVDENNTIFIEPVADSQMYVPYLDTNAAYGLWLWDDHPPYAWPPPLGYSVVKGFFAGAIAGGTWSSRINYAEHQLTINNAVQHFSRRGSGGGEAWRHDPSHRQGVNYSRLDLQEKYAAAKLSGDGVSTDFRGYSQPDGWSSDRMTASDASRSGADRGAGFDGLGRGGDMRGFGDRGYSSRTKSVGGFSGFRGSSAGPRSSGRRASGPR